MASRQRMSDPMTIETHLERAAAPQREDARDLIARLCREMGVAAVAAALSPTERPEQAEICAQEMHVPGDRLAA